MRPVLILAACAALIAGCGEIDQNKETGNTNRADVPASKGTNNGYAVKGWTPGNQGSWENQVRARGQLQNEYAKTN